MKKFRNKKLISLLAILLATACGFGLYAYNIKTSTNNTEEAVKNENGTIHYLQNRIINNSEGEHWWHSDRYTDEEWQERYGISDENNIFPKPETELLTNEEKEQIDASIMEHAESIWDVYEHVELEDGLFYTSNIKNFTDEQRRWRRYEKW